MSVTAAFSGGGGRELSLNLHLLIPASSSSLQQPPEGVALHRCSEVRLLLPPSPRIHLATSHLLLSRFYPAASLCFTLISPPKPPSPAAIRAHRHNSILRSFKGNCNKERRKLVNEGSVKVLLSLRHFQHLHLPSLSDGVVTILDFRLQQSIFDSIFRPQF